MEYKDLEDFVFSRSFRSWVFGIDSPEAEYWENWLARHPDKAELVQHAKAIIYALQTNLRPLSEEEIDGEIRRVMHRMRDPGATRSLDDFQPERTMALSRRPSRAWGLAGWAVCLCIIAWSVILYSHRHRKDVLHTFLAGNNDRPMRELTGEADTGRNVLLPDGSRVCLQPKSKLYYPEGLLTTGHRREVFLEGEGFFDIIQNAGFPFYVYTHTLTAKVLGTSFSIKAWPDDVKTIVSVRTGKIAVYREEGLPRAAGEKEPGGDERAAGEKERAPGGKVRASGGKEWGEKESGGVVVTPNQELVYDRDSDRMNKTLAQQPGLIAGRDTVLLFDATPVAVVFHRLQDVYGIPIMYDEESVAGRSLSASLNEGNFYEKLNAICKAIGATWEAIDGNIVIYSFPGSKIES